MVTDPKVPVNALFQALDLNSTIPNYLRSAANSVENTASMAFGGLQILAHDNLVFDGIHLVPRPASLGSAGQPITDYETPVRQKVAQAFAEEFNKANAGQIVTQGSLEKVINAKVGNDFEYADDKATRKEATSAIAKDMLATGQELLTQTDALLDTLQKSGIEKMDKKIAVVRAIQSDIRSVVNNPTYATPQDQQTELEKRISVSLTGVLGSDGIGDMKQTAADMAQKIVEANDSLNQKISDDLLCAGHVSDDGSKAKAINDALWQAALPAQTPLSGMKTAKVTEIIQNGLTKALGPARGADVFSDNNVAITAAAAQISASLQNNPYPIAAENALLESLSLNGYIPVDTFRGTAAPAVNAPVVVAPPAAATTPATDTPPATDDPKLIGAVAGASGIAVLAKALGFKTETVTDWLELGGLASIAGLGVFAAQNPELSKKKFEEIEGKVGDFVSAPKTPTPPPADAGNKAAVPTTGAAK